MIDLIRSLTDNLLCLSGVQSPFEVIQFKEEKLSVESYLRAISQRSQSAGFDIETVDEFLNNQVEIRNDKNFLMSEVDKYIRLREVLNELSDVRVYKIGRIHRNAYIVGYYDHEFIIIATEIVEE